MACARGSGRALGTSSSSSRSRARAGRRAAGGKGASGGGGDGGGAETERSYAENVEEIVVGDLLYLDGRAKEDTERALDAVKGLGQWLQGGRTPTRAELEEKLAAVRAELEDAHREVHLGQARVEMTLQRLGALEDALSGKDADGDRGAAASSTAPVDVPAPAPGAGVLSTRDVWLPVAFSTELPVEKLVAFELEGVPYVLFRDGTGQPSCILDECAHRACPLSLGKVVNGRAQCPYHGWEYSGTGACEHMPSTRFLPDVIVPSMPCVETDGLVWVWPGQSVPSASLPRYQAPEGYATVSEVAMDVPCEHGALLERLADFNPSAFRSVPKVGVAGAAANALDALLQASRLPSSTLSRIVMRTELEAVPVDATFLPPCTVTSSLVLRRGYGGAPTQRKLHQTHVCLPGARGQTRLLYRLSIDFVPDGRRKVPDQDAFYAELGRTLVAEEVRAITQELEPASQNAASQ